MRDVPRGQASTSSSRVFGAISALGSAFSAQPDEEYPQLLEMVLQALHIGAEEADVGMGLADCGRE